VPWAPDYATVAELRAFLTRSSETVDDAELAFVLAAASRAIDWATNRQFGNTTAQARLYTACWDRFKGRYYVTTDDIHTTTGLLVAQDDDDNGTYDGPALTLGTDFELFPFNEDEKGKPWTQLWFRRSGTTPTRNEGGIRVTAQYGWASVPVPIKEATLLQASRFFVRRNAPFGVAGSPETGSEMRLLARADPDVEVSVRPFWRAWGGV
jgi:hypothetical protein